MTRALAVRRTVLAYGVLGLLVAVVTYPIWAFTIGLVWGVLISLVIGAAVAALVHRQSDASALKALDASPLPEGRYPRLDNMVEGLTVAHGFRVPAMYVVDDAAPNAAVLARTPRAGVLVLTTGLIDRLDRVQLESVLAHELMRIRTGEAMANLTAAALPGRLAGVAAGPACRVADMITDGLVVIEADRAATEITRYPPGLEGALASIHADGRTVARNSRAHRHLWLNTPADAVVSSTFDLGDRIAVLQEL